MLNVWVSGGHMVYFMQTRSLSQILSISYDYLRNLGVLYGRDLFIILMHN